MAAPRPRRTWRRLLLLGGIVVLLLLAGVAGWLALRRAGINLEQGVAADATLTLPAGFQAGVFASGLSNPRFLTVGPDGLVYVAERGRNRIVALPDANGDGRADSEIEVAGDLHQPSSLTFDGAALLVGEEDQVTRLTLDAAHHATGRTVLIPNLPHDGSHTTKTVLIGPDGRLYLAMGSSCNICVEPDPHRAAVLVYNADGSGGRVFSRGLRNAVGLAVNPVTGAIWATNNGRDFLGDDQPPETVNVLQDGADFGWPRCHAGTLVDPDFGTASGCTGVTAPVATMHAHMAPLGLAFYKGTQFPPGFRDSLYVAFHGSWNSSQLVGYKVMRVPLQDGQVAGRAGRLRYRLAAERGRHRASGGHRRGAGRQPAGQRRQGRVHLPHRLPGDAVASRLTNSHARRLAC